MVTASEARCARSLDIGTRPDPPARLLSPMSRCDRVLAGELAAVLLQAHRISKLMPQQPIFAKERPSAGSPTNRRHRPGACRQWLVADVLPGTNEGSKSSAFRTLVDRSAEEKGFWMKWIPSFKCPSGAMTLAVKPDMNRHLRPG